MKIYEYNEMMRYLTRKPTPAASGEELGTREGFSDGTTLQINPMLDNINPNTIGGGAIIPALGVGTAAIKEFADKKGISFDEAIGLLKKLYTGPSVLQKTIDTPEGKVYAPDDPIPAKPDIEKFPSGEKQETTLVTKKPDQIKTDIGLTPPTIDTEIPGLQPDTGEDTSVLSMGAPLGKRKPMMIFTEKEKQKELPKEIKNLTDEKLEKYLKDNFGDLNDVTYYKAFKEFADRKFGGGAIPTANYLGEKFKYFPDYAKHRGFEIKRKNSLLEDSFTPLSGEKLKVGEFTSKIKNDENYLNSLTAEVIKKNNLKLNNYYTLTDLVKIFNLDDRKRTSQTTKEVLQSSGELQKILRSQETPFKPLTGTQAQGVPSIYKLRDVVDSLNQYGLIKQEAVAGIQPEKRRGYEKEIDSYRVKIIKNLNDNFRETVVSNVAPNEITSKAFLQDGHANPIDTYSIGIAKKAKDNLFSAQTNVWTHPVINEDILPMNQSYRKSVLIKLDTLSKKSKLSEEDIETIKQLDNKLIEGNNKTRKKVISFVNKNLSKDPTLINQDKILFDLRIKIPKVGEKLTEKNIYLDDSYVDKSLIVGNIDKINPKVNKISDLSKKELEIFKTNLLNQKIDQLRKVYKSAYKFSNEDIKELAEDVLFGIEERPFLKRKKYEEGGQVKLANGSDDGYMQEIPTLPYSDPIDILEQQMINEKDPIKILMLDEMLTQMKKRQVEKEKAREEEKVAQKAKGVKYKEDFPSEAAYFAETGKQILTNPKYFLSKGAKGIAEGTEFLIGQPLQTLFSQTGKNFEFYQPVAGEKLGINKLIEQYQPKEPTTGTLLAGTAVEIAGSILDPFLAYGIVKGVTKASKTKTPVVIEEKLDPARRDILKTGAILTGAAIVYPTAKKLGLLETSVKATKAANAVRVATSPVVDNMPEFFPYLSEFSRRRGKVIGEDYMRSGMTEFKREITIPLELNTIEKTKTNVTFEFIHNPADGNVTAYYTNPLTDEKHMFDFYTGKQGKQLYGSDPEIPNATEFYSVEVEPPGFYYKSPNKADPYRKDFEYYDTATEGDDVIQALDKWYKGLSKEEKAKFENKFITHSEYTDEIPASSYENTDENYPIMDFMYPKKKND